MAIRIVRRVAPDESRYTSVRQVRGATVQRRHFPDDQPDWAQDYERALAAREPRNTKIIAAFLRDYARQRPEDRPRGVDVRPLLVSAIEALFSIPPARLIGFDSMLGDAELLDLLPEARERVRRLATKVATAELARGYVPDARLVRVFGLGALAVAGRPKLSPEHDAIADAFAPEARGPAAWLLADAPTLASDAKRLAADAADLPGAQQVWLLNRLRTGNYRPWTACPPFVLATERALEMLGNRRASPGLWLAALSALDGGGTNPAFEGALSAMTTRELGRVVATFKGSADPILNDLRGELDARQDAAAGLLGASQSHLYRVLRRARTMGRVVIEDGRSAAERADAFIAAGRDFIGQPLRAATDELSKRKRARTSDADDAAITIQNDLCLSLAKAKRRELVLASDVDEDLAAALVATIDLREGKEDQRARLYDALITPIRLSRGVAMHRMKWAKIADEKERANFDFTGAVVPDDKGRPIYHELGHALEMSRVDLSEASHALVERRKLADMVFPHNDLEVVWRLSWSAAVDSQRRLLQRMIDRPVHQPLNSIEAVRELADGMGFDDAIDKLGGAEGLGKIRTYKENEHSYPMLGMPYLGKAYMNSTEVVSLAFEKLASKELMVDTLLRDPELLYFVIGALLSEMSGARVQVARS